MAEQSLQVVQHGNEDVVFCSSGIKIECSFPRKRVSLKAYGFFASVNQAGIGFAISPNPPTSLQNAARFPCASLHTQFVSVSEPGFQLEKVPQLLLDDELEIAERLVKEKKEKGGFKLRIKIGNESLRRLMSGAVAGAVSRTAVAPLETLKTHLMVGSCGDSMSEVFDNIMRSEGWKGLFRGNLVNVIRVAPSKAIELFAYETAKKQLTTEFGEQPKLPLPASFIAGAVAGVSSTLCTYPLEMLKTRLTVNEDYKNLLDAIVKIVRAEGAAGLYEGLTPSLIGVVPYAASNYFAYDTLRKAYKQAFKEEEIGNIMTLLIGSAAGAISSTATFPLEVARKQMQAGAINGRQYHNMLHALTSMLEKEGISGIYRGLGPSCMKLVPAAGISFMCYEACKSILTEKEEAL
ncbi:adenine nucleotide transporter BT1, chloroplastic/mitochondrial-like [Durio zibethinus]|uniref:Adenine nucleotide transporter BT1, chloroplastic/mitochondrial-like n=1 Tax=Durio zibethinus TaxID=66656 RepID=A0A6P5XSC5_DURZI|nr:adenine nucleotide transporter BT1, chloroplastic/mitochondrial-like [Durio zibethinus]